MQKREGFWDSCIDRTQKNTICPWTLHKLNILWLLILPNKVRWAKVWVLVDLESNVVLEQKLDKPDEQVLG